MKSRTDVIALVAFLAIFSHARSFAESAPKPPNVVLILADDLAWRDMGFMGNGLVHTPNIDSLAAKSACFVNGYVPMSVCRPSLATLLTGLYPHQHGIHFNHPPPGLSQMRDMSGEQYRGVRASTNYLIESVPTLPRILATHGYRSFQSGKHWEGSYRTAGFTHGMTTGLPTQRVSDITGTRAQKNGDLVAHGNGDAGLVIGRETMQPLLDFIDQQSQESPFFLWYAPFLPHTPFDAPERFREVYTDRSVPAYLLPYYAEIARFDETVGTLIAALRERNLMQETIVIFVSDNGFRPDISAPDRQDKRSKLSEFDDGLRTPILIYQEGRTCCNQFTQLVHTVDLVPTILDAVGYSEEVTPRMKGVSLWKAATTGTPPEDRPVFGAIYPNDAEVLGQPSRHVRFRWVRKGSWKLIVPAARDRSGGLRLFNLNDDPTELHNLANNPDHQSLIAELQQALNQWWTGNDNADVTQR